MKIALDPYMFRRQSLPEMVRTVAELGYPYIELSPRDDFLPFFLHPRADKDKVAELRTALRETGVKLSSLLPLYRWSGPEPGGASRRHPQLETGHRNLRGSSSAP